MSYDFILKIAIFLPLLMALYVGLNSQKINEKFAQFLTTSGIIISAIFSGIIFYKVVSLGEIGVIPLLSWIKSGDLNVAWSLRVDVLTAIMLIVVTWVSAVVHLYSIGYMSHDEHKPRFMAYLSFFTFCMLMLVTANNFMQIFFGWEGVGLSSYLLIGFWYKKNSANSASIKAFIVNRVGDIGLALGVCLIFYKFNTLQFDEVFAKIPILSGETFNFIGINAPLMDIIALLLFIGAMGKSAQFILHTWLPDAMEGPTPVSALIHAATMVTAGVFLLARCSAIFEAAPFTSQIVTIIGAFTAFFAATIAITQTDIKRVIAYSTCSQLGYMFFACGVGAYSAAIFHLMTHAFFKALLFLGAGSVIHASSDEQDMRNMGGLAKKIPFTYILMWIGSLALAGIPPFAGYFSKDIILESSFVAEGLPSNIAFVLGIIAAFMTAFYSWRLLFIVFHGKSRASTEVKSHIHESPKIMLFPLVFLAIGAIIAGFVGSSLFHITSADGDFWRGALIQNKEVLEAVHHSPIWVKHLPLIVGLFAIFLAWILYIKAPKIPSKIVNILPSLYKFSLNKWYIDELYERIFIRPAKNIGMIFWKICDVNIVDRFLPNGSARLVLNFGFITKKIQSGFIYHYAFAMLIGVLIATSWLVYSLIIGI